MKTERNCGAFENQREGQFREQTAAFFKEHFESRIQNLKRVSIDTASDQLLWDFLPTLWPNMESKAKAVFDFVDEEAKRIIRLVELISVILLYLVWLGHKLSKKFGATANALIFIPSCLRIL